MGGGGGGGGGGGWENVHSCTNNLSRAWEPDHSNTASYGPGIVMLAGLQYLVNSVSSASSVSFATSR